MKTYVPDYYPDFTCIAGKCRHSCCEGWEIDIDPESLARFRVVGGEIGRRLQEDIEETAEGACFRLRQGDRCPFLNDRNLCDLVIELGEESLCQICADHPRFRNFLAGREEMGLGMCCEEAARLILTQEEPSRLIEWDDDGLDEEPDEMEADLLTVRSALIDIMQDRSMPVLQCVGRMLEVTGVEEQRTAAEWAAFLLELERLDEGWTRRLQALSVMDGAAESASLAQFETAFEQLMVYYLFRHMPGAAQDGDMQGRLLLCVLLWRIVRAIAVCEGADMAALIDIARMCSSEIEYSDVNIDAILAETAYLA